MSDAQSAIRARLSLAAPVASLYLPSESRSHAYDDEDAAWDLSQVIGRRMKL
jgi:hypothetical protein